MILDLILIVAILIIISVTMIDYREVMERIREIQDDIMSLLSKIPSVYTLTILLMSGILIMSFLVAIVPKT